MQRVKKNRKVPKLAIVGCGAVFRNFYRRSLATLQKEGQVEVVALIEPDPSSLIEALKTFSAASGFRSTNDWSDSDSTLQVDAAVVLTPPNTHFSVCESLTKVCRRIYCEKPLVVTPAEGERLKNILAASNATCVVAYARRQYPNFLVLKELGRVLRCNVSIRITDGEVFRWPIGSKSIFSRDTPGSGVVWDKLVHNLDTVNWLSKIVAITRVTSECRVGSVPTNVYVEGRTQLGHFATRASWTQELDNQVIIKSDQGSLITKNSLSSSVTSTIESVCGKIAVPAIRTYEDAIRATLEGFIRPETDKLSNGLVSLEEDLNLIKYLDIINKLARKLPCPEWQ